MRYAKKRMTKFLIIALLASAHTNAWAQYEIKPAEGYTPKVGELVNMLELTKTQIEAAVRDLNQEQTDFRFDQQANSIGALIMHLAATEAYYQLETLDGTAWTAEDMAFWGAATNLREESHDTFAGKPIGYYLEQWNGVREKSLAGLRTKDDAWLSALIEEGINNYFAWFHVLDHSSNHMGQIALILKRLPD